MYIAVEADVNVETLAFVAALLFWETGTSVAAIRDVDLIFGYIVGTPAVVLENNTERRCAFAVIIAPSI